VAVPLIVTLAAAAVPLLIGAIFTVRAVLYPALILIVCVSVTLGVIVAPELIAVVPFFKVDCAIRPTVTVLSVALNPSVVIQPALPTVNFPVKEVVNG